MGSSRRMPSTLGPQASASQADEPALSAPLVRVVPMVDSRARSAQQAQCALLRAGRGRPRLGAGSPEFPSSPDRATVGLRHRGHSPRGAGLRA
jgi:hypothetical protein